MKLLLVNYSGYPSNDKGGGEKIIYLLAKELSQAGLTVDFLSSFIYQKNIRLNNRISNSRKKKKVYDLLIKFTVFFLLDFFRKTYLFNRALRSTEYDVIHCHDVLSAFLCRNAKAKKIVTIHSKGSFRYDLQNNSGGMKYSHFSLWFIQIIEKFVTKSIKHWVFPSLGAYRIFASEIGMKEEFSKHTKIIYNGIDVSEVKNIISFEDHQKKYGNYSGTIMINVANHVEPKNILFLLELMREMKKISEKKFLLINIGFGPDTEKYLHKVKEFGLERSVKFLGKLNYSEVISLMKVSDIFIMPSRRVVYDLVVLEALVSNLFLYLSDEGGNKEIKSKFSSRIHLFSLDDMESLIISLLNFKGTCKSLNKEEQTFLSANRMAREYYSLYSNEL